MAKKLLLLGSVVSPCPPQKQGGTERVAYYQAKQLLLHGLSIIFVGAKGTAKNFRDQFEFEQTENIPALLKNIEFVEIGGGTGFGTQEDAIKINPEVVEASRKLRLELLNLTKVQELIIKRSAEFEVILNNMRGEAIFLPLAKKLNKTFINVMHLNLFPELAKFFLAYQTPLISISNSQRQDYPDLNYLDTIYNPINSKIFAFSPTHKNYALMISTIGAHKNQKDAILACKKAAIPLILSGKIRDKDYFDKEIAPHIDNKNLIYYGELKFTEKLKLYQNAKVFLFPIKWQEPFGLVCIEALSCGTPVISYPHGGPAEIVVEGKNGYLVNTPEEMAEKIAQIDNISREACRQDSVARFSEEVIGQQYFQCLQKLASF